jgi:hypothetical protein
MTMGAVTMDAVTMGAVEMSIVRPSWWGGVVKNIFLETDMGSGYVRAFYPRREHHTMTQQPPQIQPPTLDPATLTAVQRATIGALPSDAGATTVEADAQRAGALALLAALHPRDLVEATLATRIVAAHYAAMECFRRAAQDTLPAALHPRIVGKAVALCGLMDTTMRTLTQRQGGEARPLARRAAALPRSAPATCAQPSPETSPVASSAQPPVAEGGTNAAAANGPSGALPRPCSGPDARRTQPKLRCGSGRLPRLPRVRRPRPRRSRRNGGQDPMPSENAAGTLARLCRAHTRLDGVTRAATDMKLKFKRTMPVLE